MPEVNIKNLNLKVKGVSEEAVRKALQDLGPQIARQLKQQGLHNAAAGQQKINHQQIRQMHVHTTVGHQQASATALRNQIAGAVSSAVSRKINATNRSTK